MSNQNPELVVLYQWAVDEDDTEELIAVWKVLTEALRIEAGSLGSRLHIATDGTWYGYAQWPSEEIWRNRTVRSNEGRQAGIRFGQLARDVREPVLLRLEADLFTT